MYMYIYIHTYICVCIITKKTNKLFVECVEITNKFETTKPFAVSTYECILLITHVELSIAMID